ncbi:hypothetical protein TPY_1330 [Sulfobacillus acidophilus TPY]|nr:hypothetical protein TPY_1330 [Sulfobacillus acidophilus TPY]
MIVILAFLGGLIGQKTFGDDPIEDGDPFPPSAKDYVG